MSGGSGMSGGEAARLFVSVSAEVGDLKAKMDQAQARITQFEKQAAAGAQRGAQSIENAWNRAGSKVQNVTRSMEGAVIRYAKYGLLAAGAAAVGFGMKSIQMAGQMEQSKIAFTTMLGSAKKAGDYLKQLKAFAASTPFEFMDLQDAAKRMMAYGFAAKSVLPMLTNIGDATSGLGTGKEGMNSIILALGQMKAIGKVRQGEITQLAGEGVGALEMLSKALGKTKAQVMDMASKGQISADVGIKAIMAGMHGKFGGLMAKQSASLLGIWSNFRDKLGFMMADFGKTLMGKLHLKENMNKIIAAMGTAEFKAKMNDLADSFVSFVEKAQAVAKWLYTNRDALMSAGKAALFFYGSLRLLGIASSVAGGIRALTTASVASEAALGAGGLGKAAVATGARMSLLRGAMSLVPFGPWGLGIAAVGTAAYLAHKHLQQYPNTMREVAAEVGNETGKVDGLVSALKGIPAQRKTLVIIETRHTGGPQKPGKPGTPANADDLVASNAEIAREAGIINAAKREMLGLDGKILNAANQYQGKMALLQGMFKMREDTQKRIADQMKHGQDSTADLGLLARENAAIKTMSSEMDTAGSRMERLQTQYDRLATQLKTPLQMRSPTVQTPVNAPLAPTRLPYIDGGPARVVPQSQVITIQPKVDMSDANSAFRANPAAVWRQQVQDSVNGAAQGVKRNAANMKADLRDATSAKPSDRWAGAASGQMHAGAALAAGTGAGIQAHLFGATAGGASGSWLASLRQQIFTAGQEAASAVRKLQSAFGGGGTSAGSGSGGGGGGAGATGGRGRDLSGRLSGPGTGTSDSMTARVSNDEFIIKAKSARKIGYGTLDHINDTGEMPGFAGGGKGDKHKKGKPGRHQKTKAAKKAAAATAAQNAADKRSAAWQKKRAGYEFTKTAFDLQLAKDAQTTDVADDNVTRGNEATFYGGKIAGLEAYMKTAAYKKLTQADQMDVTQTLADAYRQRTELLTPLENAASASPTEDIAAQLAQSQTRASNAEANLKLSQAQYGVLTGSNDIGYSGGSNALQAAGGAQPITNYYQSLVPTDPRMFQAVSSASNVGNSSGVVANQMYSGKVSGP